MCWCCPSHREMGTIILGCYLVKAHRRLLQPTIFNTQMLKGPTVVPKRNNICKSKGNDCVGMKPSMYKMRLWNMLHDVYQHEFQIAIHSMARPKLAVAIALMVEIVNPMPSKMKVSPPFVFSKCINHMALYTHGTIHNAQEPQFDVD